MQQKLCIAMKISKICPNVSQNIPKQFVRNILVYFIKYSLFTAPAGRRYIFVTDWLEQKDHKSQK